MSDFIQNNAIDWLFFVRLVPLILAGFITSRSKDLVGMSICILYIAVIIVTYFWHNQALSAVFSTPLVFLTSWYIIKPDLRNRRNQRLKKIKLVKEK